MTDREFAPATQLGAILMGVAQAIEALADGDTERAKSFAEAIKVQVLDLPGDWPAA